LKQREPIGVEPLEDVDEEDDEGPDRNTE